MAHLYITSKNTGPSWNSDPVFMIYIGTSYFEALEVIPENFVRYEKNADSIYWPENSKYPHIYSALPPVADRKYIKFYTADGWWYSIVRLEVPDTEPQELCEEMMPIWVGEDYDLPDFQCCLPVGHEGPHHSPSGTWE